MVFDANERTSPLSPGGVGAQRDDLPPLSMRVYAIMRTYVHTAHTCKYDVCALRVREDEQLRTVYGFKGNAFTGKQPFRDNDPPANARAAGFVCDGTKSESFKIAGEFAKSDVRKTRWLRMSTVRGDGF